MEPEAGDEHEVEGVLNPAAVRGPDGQLYLFPALVAAGNYSRIGIARVIFNGAGDPTRVERLGIALEPQTDYEILPHGGGGCEDLHITFMETIQRYVMTYTARRIQPSTCSVMTTYVYETIPQPSHSSSSGSWRA